MNTKLHLKLSLIFLVFGLIVIGGWVCYHRYKLWRFGTPRVTSSNTITLATPFLSFQTATLKLNYFPGKPSGFSFHSSSTDASLHFVLQLCEVKIPHCRHLEVTPAGVPSAPYLKPTLEFKKVAQAKVILESAPDGHALAFSYDEGKKWSYIPLDRGETFFFCDDYFFPGTNDRHPDWTEAKTTDALVRTACLRCSESTSTDCWVKIEPRLLE